ncbi:uncharacterized protein SPAPADRAFT_60104 [Spathaspora passalidarum NRRL Y-27907]|uniref:Autophagy-related protein 33 n=1 Tax=Spathaspora passalidarum (strain NRRL Y-27907 / 11-Y1) TaxID=619300 RepID=G3AM47_SPAPN|nr:uncharacterized protein SPAPADRAFT_60104 [Spathaspora passalidarum NRRL Y-27907]EGW32752.1 hypothetical protein SPAPADRAFT_60104 [Spathaspora passalidarum NRRL Y-27907]
MAGTCISTIKLLGWGSLGLLTTSLTYQSAYQIPQFITKIKREVTSSSTFQTQLKDVVCSIVGSRFVNIALGVLATGLFSLAYEYSPLDEKHPYLLYSAIGAPLTIIGLYARVYKYENRMLSKKQTSIKKQEKSKPEVVPEEQDEEPELISKVSSQDDQLGKSYVHLSEDSGTSTPTSISSPEIRSISPQPVPVAAKSEPAEVSIDEEVEQALAKKEVIHDLTIVKSEYTIGVSISAISLLIASIGIFGDFYLL